MGYSPHHAQYTRYCSACRRRRLWRHGHQLRLADRALFICRECSRRLLDRVLAKHARQRRSLARRQRAEIERLLRLASRVPIAS